MQIAFSLLLLLLAPVEGLAKEKLRYTVQHVGREVGRLQVVVGDVTAGLRVVDVKGRVAVPGSTLDMTMASKTAMTASHLTEKLDWRFAIFGAPRAVKGEVKDKRFQAESVEGTETKKIDQRRESGIGDLLTVGFWFASQDPAAVEVKTAAFAGFFVYDIVGKAGPLETLALPAGPRVARRWEITATRPGKTRVVTMWTDPKRRIPVMARVDLDFLGNVQVMLMKEHR